MSHEPVRITSIDVDIDAPADIAWGILIDFPNYGRWNSFTPRIDAHLDLEKPIGTELSLWVPGMKGADAVDAVTHYIRVFDRPRHLAWEHPPTVAVPHLTRRDQYLETLYNDRCRYCNTDTFMGETAQALYAAHHVWVQQGLDAVARDLKVEAERIALLARS